MRRFSPLLAVAAIAAGLAVACGADSAERSSADPGGSGGGGVLPADVPTGGPLATAGPDRKVLAGEVVSLDARGSSRGEDGRAIAFFWTQEEGPRVALDDPSATVARFVAPARTAREGDRMVFRLQVSDGARASFDRVAIEVVDRPEQIEPALVALGGADQEVMRGARVQLPAPTFVDAACLGEDCQGETPSYCWSQVEGAPVALEDACDGVASFDAPARPGVLTFRLDAHRTEGANHSPLCRAVGAPSPDRPSCAPPDYVRVFVREQDTRSPPSAWIKRENVPIPRLLVEERPAASYPQEIVLTGASVPQPLTLAGWRPLLGDPLLSGVGLTSEGMLLDAQLVLSREPGWPRAVGIAFEAQYRRMRAAPAAVVLAWRPPVDHPSPVARGSAPCGPASEDWCAPFVEGDVVTLRGEVPGHGAPASIESCWEQLSGPPVTLEPDAGCLPGLFDRTFVAPAVPEGAPGLGLSFRFTVRDGGPLSSLPDIVVVQVVAQAEVPPAELVVPAELHPGSPALLQAAGATGMAARWRKVWMPDSPIVSLATIADCEPAGSCATVVVGEDAVGRIATFDALLTDASGATWTRRVEIPVVP